MSHRQFITKHVRTGSTSVVLRIEQAEAYLNNKDRNQDYELFELVPVDTRDTPVTTYKKEII